VKGITSGSRRTAAPLLRSTPCGDSRVPCALHRSCRRRSLTRIVSRPMSALLAILISIIACFFAAYGTWMLDQRFFKCGTTVRGLSATALVALSIWLLSLILAALLLSVPGAHGPVQYWGGLTPFFGVRTFATFSLLAGIGLCLLTVVSAVISLFQPSAGSRWLRCVCPAIALVAFASAYGIFMRIEFYPRA
jgi:hypothetical protein